MKIDVVQITKDKWANDSPTAGTRSTLGSRNKRYENINYWQDLIESVTILFRSGPSEAI